MDSEELFLQMLKSQKVRNEILGIVEGTKASAASKDATEKYSALQKENIALKQQIGEYVENLRQAEEERAGHAEKEAAYRQMFNDKETEVTRLSDECQRMRDKLGELQEQYRASALDVKNLRAQVHDYYLKNDELMKNLQQRFSDGWELFELYQKLTPTVRQILKSGVFVNDKDFTSFICCAAQTDSLTKVWDVAKDSLLNGQKDDAEIIRKIFEYCLTLVNASKVRLKYEYVAVKEGDRFDANTHEKTEDSKEQGKVSHVYLKGFCNTYSGDILRKSLVSVR